MEAGSNSLDENFAFLERYCIKEKSLNPKVSIIIPAYNTEKFILKCISSLIRQTLKDVEIIVVNDGSTDGTKSILERVALLDARVTLINQNNQKQGAARNNGMKLATGEYIGFVDSDDWVDLDYYEKLYCAAKKYNSDIALATNVRIGNGKTKKRLNILKEKFVSEMQDKFDICMHFGNECPTNKIYRSEFIKNNNIMWPVGVYCEDKLYTAKALYYANAVVAVPDIKYYYFRNPNSTVNTKEINHSKKKQRDKNDARRAVIEFLREKNVQLRDKELWMETCRIAFCGIPFFVAKESLNTKRILVLGLVVYERPIKEVF